MPLFSTSLRRGTDVVGQSLMNALAGFGQSLAQGYQYGQNQKQAQDLWNQISTRQEQIVPNVPAVPSTGGGPTAVLPRLEPIPDPTVQNQTVPTDPFVPSNILALNKIQQLSPGFLQTMAATSPKTQFIPQSNGSLSVGQVGPMGNVSVVPVMGPTPKSAAPRGLNLTTETMTDDTGKPMLYSIGRDSTTGAVVRKDLLGPAYEKPASGLMGGQANVEEDAKTIAAAIRSGAQPPDLKGLYRGGFYVRAELAKKGSRGEDPYDLVTAQRDWNAVGRYMNTLNGQQQTNLRQAITFTKDTLPQLKDAYDRWKKAAGVSGYKLFNRANLLATANLPGEAGSASTQLQSLISDFTSELGKVYSSGYATLNESLDLAAKNLQGDWNEKTFNDALKRLDQTLTIRYNAIKTAGPSGVTKGSPYLPGGGENSTEDPMGIR